MTRLYLIRHAQAQGNVDRVFQGRMDAPLSALGYEQLDCLAGRFADVSLDAVISSPLSRAYQTAEAVNRARAGDIRIDPRFAEIDGGSFEGVPFDLLPERFPAEYGLWEKDQAHFKAPKGESMEQVYIRVSEGIGAVLEEYSGKTVAVVSHGCALRNLLCYLKGLPLKRIGEVEWLQNTSVTLVEFPDGKTAEFRFIGDCSHLTADMLGRTKLYFGKQTG